MPKLLTALMMTLTVFAVPGVAAAQSDPQSVERVRAALQAPQPFPLTPAIPPVVGSSTQLWGGMALVQPDSADGEMIKVAVPAGELTMRAVRAVAAARHRRLERKAHEEVERALIDFQRH